MDAAGTMHARRRRRTAVVVALAGAAVLLAACGGTDGADRSAASSTTTSSTTAAPGDTAGDPSTVTVAPGGGEELATGVPTYPGPLAPPVAFDAAADFGGGLEARVTAVEPTEVTAVVAGEQNGPGVALSVKLTNGGDAPVELGAVTADLVTADGSAPVIGSAQQGEMPTVLPPGETATTTFVYLLPVDQRDDVQLIINHSTAKTAVAFSGSLPS